MKNETPGGFICKQKFYGNSLIHLYRTYSFLNYISKSVLIRKKVENQQLYSIENCEDY